MADSTRAEVWKRQMAGWGYKDGRLGLPLTLTVQACKVPAQFN